MGLKQSSQLLIHSLPSSLLLSSVLHKRNDRIIVAVLDGNVGKLFSPLPVDFVGEAGVVRVELRAVGENSVGEAIQIGNVDREPVGVLVVGDHFLGGGHHAEAAFGL